MRFRDACILAFCRLGVAGLAPRAPGTWGTALACLLAPVLFLPFGMGGRVLILLLLFVLGALAATRAERLLGRKDPGQVVIDELVGVWLVLLPFAEPGFWLVAAAFARPMGLQIQTPFVGSRAAAAPDLAGALLVAVGAAVAGVGFEVGVRLLEGLRSRMGRDPMRCLVTGGVVVAVALLVVPGLMGWAGLGTDLVVPALAEPHGGWGFALKLALTVVCLGFGLRGGEVTVMFVTGALMGSAVASLCGADPLLTGALAMAALYGVALGCPISGALVGCEFFGWGFAPWLLPCIGAAWLGRTALKGVVDQVRRHRE